MLHLLYSLGVYGIHHLSAFDVGARAGGTLFSLIETCKTHNVDVFSWLKHTLNNIQQADTIEKLEQLLPFYVKAEQLEAARAMPQLIFPEKKVVN